MSSSTASSVNDAVKKRIDDINETIEDISASLQNIVDAVQKNKMESRLVMVNVKKQQVRTITSMAKLKRIQSQLELVSLGTELRIELADLQSPSKNLKRKRDSDAEGPQAKRTKPDENTSPYMEMEPEPAPLNLTIRKPPASSTTADGSTEITGDLPTLLAKRFKRNNNEADTLTRRVTIRPYFEPICIDSNQPFDLRTSLVVEIQFSSPTQSSNPSSDVVGNRDLSSVEGPQSMLSSSMPTQIPQSINEPVIKSLTQLHNVAEPVIGSSTETHHAVNEPAFESSAELQHSVDAFTIDSLNTVVEPAIESTTDWNQRLIEIYDVLKIDSTTQEESAAEQSGSEAVDSEPRSMIASGVPSSDVPLSSLNVASTSQCESSTEQNSSEVCEIVPTPVMESQTQPNDMPITTIKEIYELLGLKIPSTPERESSMQHSTEGLQPVLGIVSQDSGIKTQSSCTNDLVIAETEPVMTPNSPVTTLLTTKENPMTSETDADHPITDTEVIQTQTSINASTSIERHCNDCKPPLQDGAKSATETRPLIETRTDSLRPSVFLTPSQTESRATAEPISRRRRRTTTKSQSSTERSSKAQPESTPMTVQNGPSPKDHTVENSLKIRRPQCSRESSSKHTSPANVKSRNSTKTTTPESDSTTEFTQPSIEKNTETTSPVAKTPSANDISIELKSSPSSQTTVRLKSTESSPSALQLDQTSPVTTQTRRTNDVTKLRPSSLGSQTTILLQASTESSPCGILDTTSPEATQKQPPTRKNNAIQSVPVSLTIEIYSSIKNNKNALKASSPANTKTRKLSENTSDLQPAKVSQKSPEKEPSTETPSPMTTRPLSGWDRKMIEIFNKMGHRIDSSLQTPVSTGRRSSVQKTPTSPPMALQSPLSPPPAKKQTPSEDVTPKAHRSTRKKSDSIGQKRLFSSQIDNTVIQKSTTNKNSKTTETQHSTEKERRTIEAQSITKQSRKTDETECSTKKESGRTTQRQRSKRSGEDHVHSSKSKKSSVSLHSQHSRKKTSSKPSTKNENRSKVQTQHSKTDSGRTRKIQQSTKENRLALTNEMKQTGANAECSAVKESGETIQSSTSKLKLVPIDAKTYPPFVVDSLPDSDERLKELFEWIGHSIAYTRPNKTGLRLTPRTKEEYIITRDFLIGLVAVDPRVQWHTHTFVNPRESRVIIYGLPHDTPTYVIHRKLNRLGYPVHYVNLYNFSTKKTGTGEFEIVMRKLDDKKLFKLYDCTWIAKHIPGAIIGPWKERQGPVRCLRCQAFGHSVENCFRAPKCVHCAGVHYSFQCQSPRSCACTKCGGPLKPSDRASEQEAPRNRKSPKTT